MQHASRQDDPVPRVGVGVIVLRDGQVLLGLRQGAHGAGTWALPGGHLEFGEAVSDCARRELLEEAGLVLTTARHGPFVDDIFEDIFDGAAQRRHYVTVFVVADCAPGDARVMEPHKCQAWAWCRWSALPQPLFQPLRSLVASGYVPPGAA